MSPCLIPLHWKLWGRISSWLGVHLKNVSLIPSLYAIISNIFHGELQRGRTFLDNYVLCRVTNSKLVNTKLEMSILSWFDFSAFTLQNSHIPGR